VTTVEHYKAWLIANCYTQKFGKNYETFAPVVRYSSVHTLLAFVVQEGMVVHQMDMVTAFLNGVQEVFAQQLALIF